MAICKDPFLAEEVVQDLFVQLWEQEVDLDKIRSPYTYLTTLIRNKIFDLMRHKSVVQKHEPLIQYEIESKELEEMPEEEKEEMLRKARELVNSLPEACREIFLMAVVEGLKYSEIAERRGISVNTVKTQLRIARQKIGDEKLLSIALLLIIHNIS